MRATLDTVLGRAFAAANSDAQAEVLNAAGAYAKRTYDCGHALEMQGCYIADELNEDGWAFLRAVMLFDPRKEH